jgi:hypothetical protein
MAEIRVLLYVVGEEPQDTYIPHDLEHWEKICGGELGMHKIAEGYSLVCNDMGKIMPLPKNRVMSTVNGGQVVLHGNFFVHKYNDEGYTVDMKDEDIIALKMVFRKAKPEDEDII